MKEGDLELVDEVGGEDVDGQVEEEDKSLYGEGLFLHQLANIIIIPCINHN